MMARVTMLTMHTDGLITLPPLERRQYRPRPIVYGQDTEVPLLPAPTTLDQGRPLELRTVVHAIRPGTLWNEFVARYHDPGFKTQVGAQMRYAVHDKNGWPLGSASVPPPGRSPRATASSDGRPRYARRTSPPLVIDNPRFPILPWFRIPNPGSHILALVCRRLPRDGTRRYNATPVLIETFVEIPRFTGVVYRASAWIHVETTQGRGRYDPHNQTGKPEMDVWLRPLAKRGKRILNRSSPPPRHDRTP